MKGERAFSQEIDSRCSKREIDGVLQTFQQAKAELEQMSANLALDLRLDNQAS